MYMIYFLEVCCDNEYIASTQKDTEKTYHFLITILLMIIFSRDSFIKIFLQMLIKHKHMKKYSVFILFYVLVLVYSTKESLSYIFFIVYSLSTAE